MIKHTGRTKNLGVIGYPVEHSLSPTMQSAAIEEMGLDYSYVAMPVRPEALEEAVRGMSALEFIGFNVTIPHKMKILPLLDALDENAKMIGAVNTVRIQDGKLTGYNTDSIGFITALKKRDFAIRGKRAVLLGAGGAARAVLWGLIAQGVASLTIGVRNPDKVKPLLAAFAAHLSISLFHWEEEAFRSALEKADLVVNTTPLGMAPHIEAMAPVDWRLISPQAFVSDLIYVPETTKFLRMARENGNRTMNGEGMLVEQGAAALKIWTEREAPTQLMTKVLREMLNT